MDSTQVGVFKESHQVSFGGFLEGQDSGALESQVALEILSDLTNQSLERKLSDEEVGRLLVTTNLTESDGARTVTVGLLHSTSGRSRFTCSLGGKLLTRSLASSGLTCGL